MALGRGLEGGDLEKWSQGREWDALGVVIVGFKRDLSEFLILSETAVKQVWNSFTVSDQISPLSQIFIYKANPQDHTSPSPSIVQPPRLFTLQLQRSLTLYHFR